MNAVTQAALPVEHPSQDQVRKVERFLLGLPQVDLRTRHYTARTPAGILYAREITVPADTVITGAVHRHECLASVCGDITVSTDDGIQRLTGYHTLRAAPGHKRVGVTHADTIWTTYHIVTSDDIESIEDELTEEAQMLLTRRGLLPLDPVALIEGALK